MTEVPLDPYRFRDAPFLTPPEAAARAGVDLEIARRFWRALGLPELDDDAVELDDEDVTALGLLREIAGSGVPADDLVVVARVYGQALARIADAETRIFNQRFVGPLLEQGLSKDEVEERLEPAVRLLLDRLSSQLDYVHRRHLGVALQRLTAEGGAGAARLTIAFADLADYSRITRRSDEREFAELIARFEEVVIESCADPMVRLVKVLGDAAMFISSDAQTALKTARALVRTTRDDPHLPAARAGLDVGHVLARGGDYFGAPVNRAARITAFARSGTVVVSEDVFAELPDDERDASPVGTRRLKGVGRVKLYKLA
ncbi:MAG: adenylate cyclase regulatory domain-containing protein [Actinomycetota bacterium]